VSPDSFTFVQVIKACAGLGTLEDGRLVHKQLIQSGCESIMSLWGVACLTCLQNVGALKRFGKCSTRCHLEMWLLGPP
jgi:hypothetical protein